MKNSLEAAGKTDAARTIPLGDGAAYESYCAFCMAIGIQPAPFGEWWFYSSFVNT